MAWKEVRIRSDNLGQNIFALFSQKPTNDGQPHSPSTMIAVSTPRDFFTDRIIVERGAGKSSDNILLFVQNILSEIVCTSDQIELVLDCKKSDKKMC